MSGYFTAGRHLLTRVKPLIFDVMCDAIYRNTLLGIDCVNRTAKCPISVKANEEPAGVFAGVILFPHFNLKDQLMSLMDPLVYFSSFLCEYAKIF